MAAKDWSQVVYKQWVSVDQINQLMDEYTACEAERDRLREELSNRKMQWGRLTSDVHEVADEMSQESLLTSSMSRKYADRMEGYSERLHKILGAW